MKCPHCNAGKNKYGKQPGTVLSTALGRIPCSLCKGKAHVRRPRR